ncbi:MAG TPA: PaaI family thioesterase [Candidatus Omnitrophota bacterium]|nr:PaaI family thioesterase [Candidatus Omnitrophota bacterium]HPD84259.1 PaaI family thioesterase [Candidatus Omnitrophota bacterium]HRZ03115.1 PaaI family thioesterase [Candidatus Omnitrophota bacterium]
MTEPQGFSAAPFEQYVPLEILERKDGFAKIRLPYKKELTNPYGLMHGGAIATLADTTMAHAVYSRYPQNKFFTISLKIEFKSPVSTGYAVAEAKITSKRKQLLFGDVIVQDDTGKTVAVASATFFLKI